MRVVFALERIECKRARKPRRKTAQLKKPASDKDFFAVKFLRARRHMTTVKAIASSKIRAQSARLCRKTTCE
jgi:hypothetical protein